VLWQHVVCCVSESYGVQLRPAVGLTSKCIVYDKLLKTLEIIVLMFVESQTVHI